MGFISKIKIVFTLIVFVSLFFLIQMMNYEYVSTGAIESANTQICLKILIIMKSFLK